MIINKCALEPSQELRLLISMFPSCSCLATSSSELRAPFRVLQHSLESVGALEVIRPKTAYFRGWDFKENAFEDTCLSCATGWVTTSSRTSPLSSGLYSVVLYKIPFKTCSSAFFFLNKKGGHNGTSQTLYFPNIFQMRNFEAPARFKKLMQGYRAQFHHGYDEKQAQRTYFLNQKIRTKGPTSPSTLMGKQDRVFEIETVPENS